MPDMNVVICPGCAWEGTIEQLGEWGSCPECGYENGVAPFRLFTLGELLKDNGTWFNDVDLGEFVRAVLFHFGIELSKEGQE